MRPQRRSSLPVNARSLASTDGLASMLRKVICRGIAMIVTSVGSNRARDVPHRFAWPSGVPGDPDAHMLRYPEAAAQALPKAATVGPKRRLGVGCASC